jgi:branched-chain amino acid transport system substrate-binding protein
MLATLAFGIWAGPTRAADPIKVGVITDMSSLFSGSTGKGTVEGARMAIEDFGPTLLGRPIELVFADHQNKTDIGAEIAQRWYENEGVSVIAGLANSAVALAVQAIAKSHGKIALATEALSSDVSGKGCTPVSVQWDTDNYAMTRILADALPKVTPDKWFIIAADYTFGVQITRDLTELLTKSGSTVTGAVRHPLNSTDFASYLIAAQQSGAKTVVISSGGGDAINILKQAREFGIQEGGQRIVATNLELSDIQSLGLKAVGGLIMPEAFYWDYDDATRAWSKRFFERVKAMPTREHASAYSGVTHWLKAVQAAGTLDAATVMAKMRATPVEDMFSRHGYIREDGRMVHDMLLVQIKTPAESKAPWDFYKVLKVIPGNDAVRPLAESECPLVKKS